MDLVSYILAKNNAGGSSSAVSPTAKVTETDDGAVITITDAEGTTTVTIKHGTDGQDGAAGAKGDTGAQGPKGDKGDTGAQGPQGEKGATGATGAAGKDGTTPVKGTDYFTDDEVQSIVDQAAAKVTADGVIIQSSTEGSTKQFRLTVTDDGVVTATPIE